MDDYTGTRCKDCFFANKVSHGIECRVNPPTVHLIPQRNAIGETGLSPVSVFPIVSDDCWCAEAWSEKEDQSE